MTSFRTWEWLIVETENLYDLLNKKWNQIHKMNIQKEKGRLKFYPRMQKM